MSKMADGRRGGDEPRREDKDLERRAKALFDDSVRGLDGATRTRLAQARARALEVLEPRAPRLMRDWQLAAAGALAVVALAVYFVPWRSEPPAAPSMQVAVLDDLELLLTEDVEMFQAELDFYAWLEEQPEFAAESGGDGDGIG
jgi:hypothetical protein